MGSEDSSPAVRSLPRGARCRRTGRGSPSHAASRLTSGTGDEATAGAAWVLAPGTAGAWAEPT